jgi:predicted PhzF superfamily epimerase YddE/YHI9
MKLDLYQIDAFTDRVFGGNPACVVPLDNWLPDNLLMKITQENAVAETAFFPTQRLYSFKMVYPRNRNGLMRSCDLGNSPLS